MELAAPLGPVRPNVEKIGTPLLLVALGTLSKTSVVLAGVLVHHHLMAAGAQVVHGNGVTDCKTPHSVFFQRDNPGRAGTRFMARLTGNSGFTSFDHLRISMTADTPLIAVQLLYVAGVAKDVRMTVHVLMALPARRVLSKREVQVMTGNTGNITSQSHRVSIVVKNDKAAVAVPIDDKYAPRIDQETSNT